MKPKKHTNKQANKQLDLTVACVAGACQCDSQTNNFTLNTHFESMVPSFSFASTEKCDSVVELLAESFTSGGRDFDTTIKFNASKGEEFDTGVALDPKLVCFAPSSLFSRDQQATVGSLFRIVHYCRIIHYY